MCLLYFVEQHNGVGLAAHALRQLAAFLVAHISRRRSYQSAHGELLHVLAHVYPYHRRLAVEQVLGQHLGQISLADARGAKEQEAAYRPVGVFQACAVAAYSLGYLAYGFVLAHHGAFQLVLHRQQAALLAFRYAFHRYAGHHGHHGGYILGRHLHAFLAFLLFPALLHVRQLCRQVALLVAVLGSLAVVLAGEHLLLHLRHLGHLGLQRHYLFRHFHVGYPHPCAGLVEGVDGFVGLQPVTHIALRKRYAGLDGGVAVTHHVVVFVFVLYIVQYLKCFLHRGGLHEHLLEAALQRGVFLYVLAVLVERRGAYALYGAAREGGLEHVAGVQAAGSAAGAHDGVYLVDEDDDLLVLFQLCDDGLHAFLELAAVLGACHQACQVEAQQAFAVERPRHVALGDPYGEAFGYGALAHAAFAYQYRVVLLPAAQYLGYAVHLLLPAHYRVQLALFGQLCQVATEILEGGSTALALLAGSRRAFAAYRRGVVEGVVVAVLAGLHGEVGQV